MTEDEIYNMIRTTFAWVEKDHRLNDIELAGELRILYGTKSPVINSAVEVLEQHALRRDIGDFIREEQEMQDD